MKTCSVNSPCAHRCYDGSLYGCNYEGYCDFQLPRDSRQWNNIPQITPLGTTGNFTDDMGNLYKKEKS